MQGGAIRLHKIDAAANKKDTDLAKIQEAWQVRLKSFVETYPTAEDTPDALLQLGMVTEFAGKETDAKNWYEILATKHAKSPLAAKAKGALKRLNSVGQIFELSAQQLGSNAPFNMRSTAGKMVAVYYWASWNQQCAADFFKLKALVSTQGIEVVTVNLDVAASEATKFLQNNPAPGVHLHQQPSGLDGALANQYGINVLPSLFLIGKDGKVISNTVQISSLEDEIKKAAEGK